VGSSKSDPKGATTVPATGHNVLGFGVTPPAIVAISKVRGYDSRPGERPTAPLLIIERSPEK
jgi:hypothetical protein